MRLLPRFSLRFALIGLTIFLVVFGTAVNLYQRYHAHERVASKMTNAGMSVEEHDSIVLGCLVSRTMVGLVCNRSMDTAEGLALLREIPRPGDLRRFAQEDRIANQESLEKLLAAITRCSNLEELHLEQLVLTAEQAKTLGALHELKILDLENCNLPPGGLAFLKQMPQLETLTLNESKFALADLAQCELPALQTLQLCDTPPAELPLTKQGWGRFPRLEKILLRATPLTKIEFEAGAMPALKYLDLAYQKEAAIAWAKLPETAPQLTGLALHCKQFKPELVQVLERMPNLRYLYLHVDDHYGSSGEGENVAALLDQPELPTDGGKKLIVTVYVPESIEPQARELIKRCPQLIFCREYDLFHDLVAPDAQGRNNSHLFPWVATTWRQGTRYTPMNPFDNPFDLPTPTPAPPYATDPFGAPNPPPLPVPPVPAPDDPFGSSPAPAAADPFGSPSPPTDPLDPFSPRSSAPAADNPFGEPAPVATDPFGEPSKNPAPGR